MLELLSDKNLIHRWDFPVESGVIANCVQGTWMCLDSTGSLVRVYSQAITGGEPWADYAWQIWNENQANTAGRFSPDVGAIGHFTILKGAYRAKTDQFTGTPAMGAGLYIDTAVGTAGRLAIINPGNEAHTPAAFMQHAIGHIIGIQTNYTYRNVTYSTVIEYMTTGR